MIKNTSNTENGFITISQEVNNSSLYLDKKNLLLKSKSIRGIIYKRTDPNGISYIGQTIDENKRNNNWLNKKKYAGTKINDARKTFGPENFSYEILFETRSKNTRKLIQLLNVMEIYFIKKFDTINNGYNSSPGGNTFQTDRFPHQRSVVQLTNTGLFIKKYESINEAKRLNGGDGLGIGECCRYLSINQNKYKIRTKAKSSVGYVWMYEENYNYILNNKIDFIKFLNDKLYPIEERVVQLDLEGNFVRELLYPTQYQNEGFIGEYITRVLAGKRETYHGFQWMWYKDYINCNKEDLIYINPFNKSVVGISFIGELFYKCKSINEASTLVNSNNSTIGQCCLYHHEEINNLPHPKNRDVRSTKGYIWMYEEDYYTIINSDQGIERYLITRIPGANTAVGVDTVNKLKQIIKDKYGRI